MKRIRTPPDTPNHSRAPSPVPAQADERYKRQKTQDNYEKWHNVSKWTDYQTEHCSISVDEDTTFTDFDSFIGMHNLELVAEPARREPTDAELTALLAPGLTTKHITDNSFDADNNLSSAESTFGGLLRKVMLNTTKPVKEDYTHDLVNFIFERANFGAGGLTYESQWERNVNIGDHITVTSIPDFAVLRDSVDALVLDEDKPMVSSSSINPQICGQFVVAALDHALRHPTAPLETFLVQFRGTNVRFYRGIASAKWIHDLAGGFTPDEEHSIKITRYPETFWNLTLPDEREKFVRALIKLRRIAFGINAS
ncbi:hypothetical protein HK097_003487 [Rhizophlyctis rosea]|uniref:Uncharacterized protein n=1 Tax=Rhizophlyctis rosea TaxID=64517 RepID=A0AAD5S442_9FUNG|nr:hypothetical protein HK097_003487 [Rhizophlyctis rosea]